MSTVLYLHTVRPEVWTEAGAPLQEALEQLSPVPVTTADAANVAVHLNDTGLRLTVNGANLPLGDIAGVVTRGLGMHASLTVETLELAGIPVSNPPAAMRTANSKFATAAALVRAGVPTINQTLIGALHPHPQTVVERHHSPAVLKRDVGSLGTHVHLLNPDQTRTKLAEPTSRNFAWVVQDFIAESAGTDLRLLVCDGHVTLTVRKTNTTGDFRANGAQGSHSTLVEPTPEQAKVALAAAQAVGLDVAGVDVMDTVNGPVVTEVNSSAGLTSMLSLGGFDVIRQVAATHLRSVGLLEECSSPGDAPLGR